MPLSSFSFSAKRRAAQWISMPFATAALLFVLFEEWIWRGAGRAMARFGNLPIVSWCENQLRSAPPWAAALAFFIPGVALLPARVFGVWLMARGQVILGGSLYALAKLMGAAAATRVYALTEAPLRSIRWINVLLDWLLTLKQKLWRHVMRSHWTRLACLIGRRYKARLKNAKAGWAAKRMAFALRREKRRNAAEPPSK